jgi:hypothetical protein
MIIDKELTEIRKQNEWLHGLYKDLNMEAVEGCLDQLSAAHEKFTVRSARGSVGRLRFTLSSLLTICVAPTSSWNSMSVYRRFPPKSIIFTKT